MHRQQYRNQADNKCDHKSCGSRRVRIVVISRHRHELAQPTPQRLLTAAKSLLEAANSAGVEGMGFGISSQICRGVLPRFEPENFGPTPLIFRRQR